MTDGQSSAPSLSDRVLGCLVGFAVGDAMGAPLQGMKAGRVVQVYGRVEDYVDADEAYARKPARWTPRGLHGSHTQFALALGDSLFVGENPAAEFRTTLLRLAGEGKSPYGCLRALSAPMRAAIRAQRDPSEGPPPPVCDPSASVFLVSLGMRHAVAESGDLAQDAAAIARLVTSDIRAVAAAIAVAEAARRVLRGEWDAADCGPEAAQSLAAWTREAELRLAGNSAGLQWASAPEGRHAVSATLAVVPEVLRERSDDLARRSIAAEASRHEPEAPFDDPQAPFAPANVAWAVYLALRERLLDAAVSDALAGGRETSAIAALVGSILGARLGIGAIPSALREGLLARGFIERRAEAYAEGNPAIVYEEHLTAAESEWTRQEAEGRRTRFAALGEKESQREQRREGKARPKKPASAAPPPTTYARPGSTILGSVDPEQARKEKALRGRKRIEWKEGRRAKGRKRDQQD